MDYYCECCDKTIKLKSKNKHFTSKAHNGFHRCDHMKISIENTNINNIGEIVCSYIIEHYRKYEYFLVKCVFELNFSDYEICPHVESENIVIKRCVSGKSFEKMRLNVLLLKVTLSII